MKSIYNVRKFWVILSVTMLAIGITGCKKWVEAPSPITSLNGENVFATDPTAIAAMTGIYVSMSEGSLEGPTSLSNTMSLYPGLSADELTLIDGLSMNYESFYKNKLTDQTSINPWRDAYSRIYICNAVIEGVGTSQTLTRAVAEQLMGEAKFMRAFYYFYLVNLYGDVSLALSTDYKVNRALGRSSQVEVYQQIVRDLLDAQGLLNRDFIDGSLLKKSVDRVRPTYWSATALLARVYLYTKDYANADLQATKVLEQTSLFSLGTINTAFLRASTLNKEAIWQLQPVNEGLNTEDARTFIIPSSGFSDINPVHLSTGLFATFESGDQRKSNWIGSVNLGGTTYYFPYKYKINTYYAPVTEFHTVFRLAELYLIRAEARANGAGTGFLGGKQDLDAVRGRAGLLGTPATTADELLTAIKKERRTEFFAEWGHRWLDLKRWGDINAVMATIAPLKNTTWNPNYQFWPLPLTDLQRNPNLVQNKDY